MLVGGRRTTRAYRRKSSIKEDDFFVIHNHIKKLRELNPNQNLRSADASILWERKSSGYRIVDLRLDRFMEALRFLLNNFFQAEPMCNAVGLYDDAVSARSYVHVILNKMSDMHSFCALHEGTGDLVGVLVASLIFQDELQSEDQSYQGMAFCQVTMLQNHAVAEAEFYKTLNADKLMHIDVLCVESKHQGNGVGTALVRSCIALTGERLLPACVGEFSSGASQVIAERLGFETLSEIPYGHYRMKEKRYNHFARCWPDNYSIACMALSMVYPEPEPLATTIPPQKQKSKKNGPRVKKKKK